MTSPRPAAAPSQIARLLAEIAWHAGEIILAHYEAGVEARQKDDQSPVTVADEEAEQFILARLRHEWPEIGVVAEEEAAAGKIETIGNRFFLVDPLDGTKEFIKKNGEFTVNIALVENGVPVLGVVHALVRRLSGGPLALIAFYVIMAMFGWPVLLVAALGLVDQWVAFRARWPREDSLEDK